MECVDVLLLLSLEDLTVFENHLVNRFLVVWISSQPSAILTAGLICVKVVEVIHHFRTLSVFTVDRSQILGPQTARVVRVELSSVLRIANSVNFSCII